MSFSSEAKRELCRDRIERRDTAAAECYGALLYCKSFDARQIRLVTGSADFAERLPKLFRRAFGIGFDSTAPESGGGKQGFVIADETKIARILEAFGTDAGSLLSHHINFGVLEEESSRTAFVRGAFLAGGSVTDPAKSYHLELATTHQSVNREMNAILLDMGFSPRETHRAGKALLYFKQADAIADFFTAIGAPATAMGVMTAKVEKEMRNTVTRQINCDSANTDKTVAAAQEQLAAIRRIAREYGSLDVLPEPLKDAALLRVTNPEASLADLAMLSFPPVSKSCLSYRLKKLMSFKPGE